MAENVVGHAIGIDLGTTYSCVAVWKDDRVHIIPNDQGHRTMPSCVSFNKAGRLIGEAAKNQMPSNPHNTIYDAKRLIGRRFSDAKLQEDMKLWPFKVINGTNDIPKIVVEYNGERKEIFAENISSMVLGKLKDIAEAYIGEKVFDAVITVPAYFDDSQRQATKDAGHAAGLNILRLINEPTSAAIAYGYDGVHIRTNITCEKIMLIFDLGGGTFDVSIVTINDKGEITVKAVAGDTNIGGQDFDNEMVDHFVKQFNKKHKIDMSKNTKGLCRLRVACEEAKRVLSSTTETNIEIGALHQGIDFSMRVTRAKFENLNADYFSKCIQMVENCLSDANVNKKDIEEVVLVGGSTRIPKVQQLLQEFFNGKELSKTIHADEAVAHGAAVLAANMSGKTSEKVKKLVLSDVVPLSLGVEVHDGSLSIITKRNTLIPAKNIEKYTTVVDNQKSIVFNIYQGERTRAVDNNWLGKFQVAVPPAPKGEALVTVVIDIDANGILNCSGEEVTTGLKREITVRNEKHRLSKQDIQQMLEDAHKYKLEDEEYKKKIYVRNALDNYIYNVKRKIKTIGNYTENDMETLENAIEEATQIVDETDLADVDAYEEALDKLEEVCIPIISRFR